MIIVFELSHLFYEDMLLKKVTGALDLCYEFDLLNLLNLMCSVSLNLYYNSGEFYNSVLY